MKVQIPILNKATGRSRDTIFQSYYGNTYARSMPILFHYPDTDKQQVTQAKFFDVQRIWIPIYNHLSLSIKRQQRINKNPFNVMSSFVYKIFHPFKPYTPEDYPENFGLDRLDRVKPAVVGTSLYMGQSQVHLSFDMLRPFNGMAFDMTTSNILLFNVTKQSMLFTDIPLQAGTNDIYFSNTNHWTISDIVVAYLALSCDSWLGNFHRIGLWSN